MTTLSSRQPAWVLTLPLLLLLLFGSGCASPGSSAGRPGRLGFETQMKERLLAKYTDSMWDQMLEDTIHERLTKASRNRVIEDYFFLIDCNYHEFEEEVVYGRAVFNVAADLSLIGLGAAGTLIPSASTKAILAAISGGVAGARTSIDKEFFREKASDAFLAQMQASRRSKEVIIRQAMSLTVEEYPLSRAMADLAEYYNAGTLVGALQKIISDAGEEEQSADAALTNVIQMQYTTSVLRDRIKGWLMANPTNVTALTQWLTSKGITRPAAFWVRDAATTADQLQAAIDALEIPN